jgi:transcriptional regulator with XRE-family HTH domain
MTMPSAPVRSRADLARRLRELRIHHWPGRTVSQRTLAEALGVSLSSISGWENENSSTTPPLDRLYAFATFFATERSVSSGRGRLLNDNDLTPSEVETRDQLYEELISLRDGANLEPPTSTPDTTIRFDWTFPTGAPVQIVCGRLENPAHPYTRPDSVNYTDLLTYADVDALVELFGHVRMANPESDIRFIRSDRLEAAATADELKKHVVLLGGIGLNDITDRLLPRARIPIKQVRLEGDPDFTDQGEVFEVTNGNEKHQFRPLLYRHDLVEDVGLLARVPNPHNSDTTLTICNGVFSRGVLGAVRALTDDKLRKQNETYLASRFSGAERFAILMRVPVMLGRALTPDLRTKSTRLYEWCDKDVTDGSDGLEGTS